jgi:large subunit ribosomal protein L35
MPKMKSHSGAKKRFKKTATGKLRARHANSSHILEKKSPKRKRGMRKPREISKADTKTVNHLLGGNDRVISKADAKTVTRLLGGNGR